MAALAPSAGAAFHIQGFTGIVADRDGGSFTQAAGHPYSATTTIEFPALDPLTADGSVKDALVDLPPGLIGNPEAVPGECTYEVLVAPGARCPIASQVGTARALLGGSPEEATNVYRLKPAPGFPARFGFVVQNVPITLNPTLRSGSDYGLTVGSPDISAALSVFRVSVTFWGVPADPSHDGERGITPPDHPTGGDDACAFAANNLGAPCDNAAGYEPTAFLTTPSDCSAGQLTTVLRASSWQEPANVHVALLDTDTNGNPMAVTGCDRVPFSPEMEIQPTSQQADSPTGLNVDLTMPTDGLSNANGLAQASLKRAVVTLPEGMTISPSSADGLRACTDAELGLAVGGPSACPEQSKIGSVTVETPLLDEALEGAIYVRSQASEDPASGEMFRVAIVVDNEQRGIRLKLPGSVAADPTTGRLKTTFDNNPQLPFSHLRLRLKAGPRAPLATPPTCGPKSATAEMTSWAGQTVTRASSFTIACPGVQGFGPSFNAGTTNPTGAAFTDFALRIGRPDGQQYMDGLTLELPEGLIAKLKDVPLCGDAAAAAGTCPLQTRVGTATVGAGPGASPYYLTGSVSLTGPYSGAPYGLSAAVRAVAGPFDLGTVVVRQALFVDPVDTHVTVVSDPLPTIVKGVPVRLRSLNVDVNRPGFMMNPTSCAAKAIHASLRTSGGAVADVSARFRAAQCGTLAFKPRLALRLRGKRQRSAGRHPGLTAVLRQRVGQANIDEVSTALPLSLALDPNNAASDSLCSFEEGTKSDPKCPDSSIVGTATAVSPLLNRPLTGPVYFTRNQRIHPKTGNVIRTLPMLIIPLRGEVAINLKGTSSVSRGRLVNTFAAVPDAPVSKFTLRLKGGKRGILTTVRNLCRRKQIARVDIDGQNGKRADRNIRIKVPCAKKGKGKRAGARRR